MSKAEITDRINQLEEQRTILKKEEDDLAYYLYGDPEEEYGEPDDYDPSIPEESKELDIILRKMDRIDEELGSLKRSLFLTDKLNRITNNSTKTTISDSLNRDSLAANIAHLINSQKKQATLSIGIIGEWGSGKSTFINLIKNNLGNNTVDSDDLSHIINFDASKYDDQEQIWYSLLSSVSAQYLGNKKIKFKRSKFIISLLKKQKESVYIYWSILIVLLFVLSLSFLISSFQNSILSQPFIKSLLVIFSTGFGYFTYDSFKSSYLSLKNYFISDEEKIFKQLKYPDYKKYLGTREYVRSDLNTFKELILQHENKNKNIVIIVDELDRCSKITIMNFFSSIEAFIDIPGIIFLFSFNPDIVYPAISEMETLTDNQRTGVEFIEKYINIFFTLPTISTYSHYVAALLEDIIDEDENIKTIGSLFDLLSQTKEISPREIKKLLDLTLIYHKEFPELSYLEFSVILILQYYFNSFEYYSNALPNNSTKQFKNISSYRIHKKSEDLPFPIEITEETIKLLPELNIYTINKNLKQINRLLQYTK